METGSATYNQHSIGDLMFADAAAKNNHSRLSRLTRQLIEIADVLDNVNDKTRRAEGMEVDHVPQGTIGQRRAKHGNIVLQKGLSECLPAEKQYLFTL